MIHISICLAFVYSVLSEVSAKVLMMEMWVCRSVINQPGKTRWCFLRLPLQSRCDVVSWSPTVRLFVDAYAHAFTALLLFSTSFCRSAQRWSCQRQRSYFSLRGRCLQTNHMQITSRTAFATIHTDTTIAVGIPDGKSYGQQRKRCHTTAWKQLNRHHGWKQ